MFAYTLSRVLSITLKTKYGTRIKQQTKRNFCILYYLCFLDIKGEWKRFWTERKFIYLKFLWKDPSNFGE
jgi:hypothetical protein